MKYDEISSAMRGFIGGREAFRRLGFRAEDLYCSVYRSVANRGLLSCFVTLRTGGKEFTLEVGPIDTSEEAFEVEYEAVCAAVNSGQVPNEDLQRMLEESVAYRRSGEFIASIMLKGIAIPGGMVS